MNKNLERKIEIKSRFKDYTVEFIANLSAMQSLAQQADTFFVFDRKVYALYKKELPDFPANRLFLLDAKEERKNIQTVLEICERMTGMNSKRNTHLVSVGGGIIQDITGFVATSLYRGIRWSFYPSTLLASCDSCIGGKSSLNYNGFKNLLGSFYPPDDIYIYPDFFQTLAPQDYCSGLGEVVKFNVIAGSNGLQQIERNIDAMLSHDYEKLLRYVQSSLLFKRDFIEKDEFDRGERVLLNFAHTFGHSFETVSNYVLPHGSAVALGMMTANHISMQRGFISEEYAMRIAAVCRKILIHAEVQPVWFSLQNILPAIRKDKKQTSKEITAVLIAKDHLLQVFHDIKELEIEKALASMVRFCEERK